ncbi:hypothetical protein [Pseudanabaena sp. BC1403]|uniref:hypothetical protein n=1 Tax=Pseudanabaena sp. BC1403 TaxID=2043171 RepID=UPI000CD94622|nr:hypothetical protein [Pseudanabaena sp. BC1403]
MGTFRSLNKSYNETINLVIGQFMLDWTQLYSQTHGFNEGAIAIASPFTGNVLAITATTKPEYAQSKQIIGYLFQDSGGARKGYALYSGKDILLLAVPQTDGLVFFPTSYLSDSYTLNIAYTSVGNILESNTAPIPDQILGLPSKVSTLESSVEGIGLALEAQIGIDLEQSNRLTALEGTISAPSWEAIADKPDTFSPSAHSHSIGDITGLSSALSEITSLSSRVDDLESSAPTGSASPNFLPVAVNTDLESGKSYLATVADLAFTLPASPAIGDVVDLATGNFSLQVNHGDASHQVLNNNTYTVAGLDKGIMLKPYSAIRLRYCQSNLWVSSFRSRVINNFTPQTIESTSSKKSYTASSANLSIDYGAALSCMYNGVKLPTGAFSTDGFLSSNTSGGILITFAEPVILDSLSLWNGQGNNSLGSASGYWTRDMTVYAGTNTSGENLGDLTFTNSTGTEQAKTLTPNTSPSNVFFLAVSSPNSLGILELELYGKAASGGEVIAI